MRMSGAACKVMQRPGATCKVIGGRVQHANVCGSIVTNSAQDIARHQKVSIAMHRNLNAPRARRAPDDLDVDVVLVFSRFGIFCNISGLPANVVTDIVALTGRAHFGTRGPMIHAYSDALEIRTDQLILQIVWSCRFSITAHTYMERSQLSSSFR